MTEAEFWQKLEYRVCREFAGMEHQDAPFFWCDGFIPKEYFVDNPLPRITGLSWIGSAPKQEQWAFELVLATATPRREDVTWDALHASVVSSARATCPAVITPPLASITNPVPMMWGMPSLEPNLSLVGTARDPSATILRHAMAAVSVRSIINGRGSFTDAR